MKRCLVSFAVIFSAVSLAQSSVILDNITPSSAFGVGSLVGSDGTSIRTKAVGVRIGSSAVSFDSLEVMLGYSQNLDNNKSISGGIYSDGLSAANPNALLASLLPQPVSVSGQVPGLYALKTASTLTLAANTVYWFRLDGPTTATDINWYQPSPALAPTASGGASLVGYRLSTDGGSSWTSSSVANAVRLNVSTVPEPATMMALGTAAVLLVRRRRK